MVSIANFQFSNFSCYISVVAITAIVLILILTKVNTIEVRRIFLKQVLFCPWPAMFQFTEGGVGISRVAGLANFGHRVSGFP